MKLIIATALLLFSSATFSQTVFSKAPTDFDYLRGQTFLFYIEEGGRKYAKLFSCSETVHVFSDAAKLLCQGGIGEDWSAYVYTRTDSPGYKYYWFLDDLENFVTPFNSYVYVIVQDRFGLTSGQYAQNIAGGMSEYKPLWFRPIKIEQPRNTAAADFFGDAGTLQLPLYVPPVPYFNTVMNRLDIQNVQVGKDFYSVVMERNQDASGFEFRVVSATKK